MLFKWYVTLPTNQTRTTVVAVGNGNRTAELQARLAPLPIAHAIRSETTVVSQPSQFMLV